MKVTYRMPDGTETVLEVAPHRALLECAEAAGLVLPWSCRSGACSDCVGRLESGSVDQSRGSYLSEAAKNLGYCLTCVSRPRSDCVIVTHQHRAFKGEGQAAVPAGPTEKRKRGRKIRTSGALDWAAEAGG